MDIYLLATGVAKCKIMNKIQLRNFILPSIAVLAIWSVFLLEYLLGYRLHEWGIFPRDVKGLWGILFSPFLHGDINHLYHNTIPLFVLLSLMIYFYPKHITRVVLWGILLGGMITWCIGRPSYHIGASGLIYALVSFIIFKGIITKNYRLTAISFLVIFLYGGMIWLMFPEMQDHISWEAHLGGFLSGLIIAFSTEDPIAEKQYKYDWESPDFNPYRDPFMKHFDEQGNFVKNPHAHTTATYPIEYIYTIVPADPPIANPSDTEEITIKEN